MTLDKMAPWELEKLLNAIDTVRALLEDRMYHEGGAFTEREFTDREVAVCEDGLLALKLLELEVRVVRAKE